MNTGVTPEEQAAIYLERAGSNSRKLSVNQLAVITLIGTNFKIKTEDGSHDLKKFFGKLYYIPTV